PRRRQRARRDRGGRRTDRHRPLRAAGPPVLSWRALRAAPALDEGSRPAAERARPHPPLEGGGREEGVTAPARATRATSPRPATPAARSTLRSVAMPTEHGGWGLTLEPGLRALLVEPSVAGALLAVAAVLAFVARTPLKLVLVDRWRGRSLPRTRLATRVAAVELVALAALLAF